MVTKCLKTRRARLLGSTATALVGLAAGFASQSAFAQAQAQQQTAATEEIEEIVVTGSRLVNREISSPVPAVQIDAAEIDARGAVRIEDVLNIMPQVVTSQTTEVANGATGTATLDLRGLGAIRTLVLVDGKRLPFGSPNVSAPNVDIVPTQLIERVDIVTGGASAVYGSDAVAGVVNFILKDDFEGMEVDAQVGFHQTGNSHSFAENVIAAAGNAGGGVSDPGSTTDGREVFATMTLGANTADDKGNVTLHFEYQNQNEILQRDRDIGACAMGAFSGANTFGQVGCVGSSNFRRFTLNDPVTLPNGDEVLDVFQQVDGTLVPFTGGPAQTFNFGPFNHFQRPTERFNIYTQGHYELTDNMEVYSTLSFMNNDTDAQIAPSASFNRPFEVNCDNPLLQNGLGPNQNGIGTLFELFRCDDVLAAVNAGQPNPITGEQGSVDIPFTNSHRNVEGDPRVTSIDITTWRAIVGFRGTLFDQFDWDVFGQFSRVLLTDTSQNDLNFNRVQEALFVERNADGELVCRSGNPECVPWNIFGRTANGETLVSDAASDFIEGTGIVTGETEQQIVGGTIQGELGQWGWQSPAATSPISALLGFEYREDTLEVVPDDISQIPGGAGLTGTGGGTLPVAGRVEVFELFMETQIPLVQDAPFIEEWALNGAYRRSQYHTEDKNPENPSPMTNEFGTDTFFVGTTWSPTESFRFRAQFQRAIRAPNVIELFTGLNTGLVDLAGDPCAGSNPQATLEQCQRTGVTPAQFGLIPTQPAGQFNIVTGGNPELEPEVADTFTFGGVYTPEWAPGLSFTIDYFDIEIEDQISTIPAQTTLEECLNTGNPTFCDLIQRDRFGSLFLDNSNFEGIQATNVNIANFNTTGFDFTINYTMDLADLGLENAGSLDLDYVSTWTTNLQTIPVPGESPTDCQDSFGDRCDTPTPAYSHRVLATWNGPAGLQATTTWRYFGSTDFGGISVNSPVDEVLESQNYFDLMLSWQATDNLRWRLGVNNLFNNEPPITTEAGTGTGNGNTFPGIFDVDRFIFFGVNIAI